MILSLTSKDPRFFFEWGKRVNRGKISFGGEPIVLQIVEDVRRRGDQAVQYWTEKLDKVSLSKENFFVTPQEDSLKQLPDPVLKTLLFMAERIETFHRKGIPKGWVWEEEGIRREMRYLPLERVGIYSPGGKALYPSTILMASIPAKVAGVKDIIVATPPRKEGVPPVLLAASYIGGVTRILQVGGVQAISALAFGTETIPRVDKIVGPGNRYITEGKRLLYGQVGIDMLAGPTELVIIADDGADPEFVALDLIAQAEHDEMAYPILLTVSKDLFQEVPVLLEKELLSHPRKGIAEKSLKNNGLNILCTSLEECLEFANAFAPEHLELLVKTPESYIEKIRNAGSVFLGYMTPEAVGDYTAGVNHILPTGESARFFSCLGVEDFLRKVPFTSYTFSALEGDFSHIRTIAEEEGLFGHSRSVEVRVKKEKR